MTNINKTANEYFLTQAQFNARKQAGTLEVGAVYHITDAKAPKKYYIHEFDYNGPEMSAKLRFISTRQLAINTTEFFTTDFVNGFLGGWAIAPSEQIMIVTSIEKVSNSNILLYSGTETLVALSALEGSIAPYYIHEISDL